MTFQEKYFLCYSYILLIDQISLSDCLYFLRLRVICVLQLFVKQVVTSSILKLTLSSQLNCFFNMTKESRKI